MLNWIIKNIFNLFIDPEQEYIEEQIKKYHNLFYHSGEYPLNRRQAEAVVKNSKYNQLIAAAGTGKTTVLAFRIKYLIEEGVAPERILAITYSKKAANEMENRLLKEFDITNVEVRTIHSMANKIIREGSKEKPSVISSTEIDQLISRIFDNLLQTDNTFQYYFYKFLTYYEDKEISTKIDKSLYPDKNQLLEEMSKRKEGVIKYFISFIDLSKKNNLQPTEIKKLLNKKNPRQYFFGLAAQMLYQNYQLYLSNHNRIDFNDMLYQAIKILEENPVKYSQAYDHLLIDEFQDVSLAQIQLIKNFFHKGSKMKLFCVGDDWQSIYSFQGSEPKFFIDFDKYFGKASKSYLVDNYRCPPTILEAGNQLIASNKRQIKKKVRANKESNSRPILHILADNINYESYLCQYTVAIIKKLLRRGCQPADIMVLCRYDQAVPYLKQVKKQLKKAEIPYLGKGNDCYNPGDTAENKKNAVSVFSVHQAKGCEAKHVILMHMLAEDPYSFPESERENELIAPVKINQANHLEEERRLFYVALTRTAQSMHIISRENNLSPFLKEIESYLRVKKIKSSFPETGEYIDLRARTIQIWKEHSEKIQQVGLLKDSQGKVIKFISWQNTNAPTLKEDTCYQLLNIKVSKFNNKEQLIINNNSRVIELKDN